MTPKTTIIGVAAAIALVALNPARATAQGAPPPPPRVAPATPATTPAASPAPAAKILVPASAPVPPAPSAQPKIVTPASAQPPSDSAVALCMNGTFVKLPGTASDCASQGGLRIALASHIKTPPPAPGTPAAAAAIAARSSNVRAVSASVAPPIGATARCKDASFVTTTPSSTMCDGHGGVSVIFPAAKATPTAPIRRP
jgi:hypothetical protein